MGLGELNISGSLLVDPAVVIFTEMQVLKYLDDNDKSIQNLKRHPITFGMFLRYNTTLPSSSPVERLFFLSCWLTLTPHRNRLSDKAVEQLILLRTNTNCF